MKVFAFAVGDRSRASSRLRVWDHIDWLRQQGHTVRTAHAMPIGAQRITLSVALFILGNLPRWCWNFFWADRVLIQESTFLSPIAWLRDLGKRRQLLFDFSDPVDTLGRGFGNRVQRAGFNAMTRHSTHVVVENLRYLTELQAQGVAASHWYGPVDVARYQVAAQSRSGHASRPVVRIGWTGSPGTISFIEPLFPALDALAATHAIELALIGAPPLNYRFEHLKVHILQWDEQAEFEQVPEFDLGLFVLDGSPKSLRRGAGKLFIYLASGVACVASDIGIAHDLMRDAQVGFAVGSPSAWPAVLERAVVSTQERMSMAERGVAYAREKIDYVGYRGLLSRVWLRD